MTQLRVNRTLAVSDETYERLEKYGRFKETYDELLNRLMDNMDVTSEKKEKKKEK